uniref:hypothetical protein n=1 Tax=Paractinoplanes polyasparticus TaxID=2856853 RepID=UPI001C8534B0|nr:hypothetical protein [Actinoplanes polyasparticus]
MTTVVLDIIERLLLAASHPDIVKVERYGPNAGPWGPSAKSPGMDKLRVSGVKVTHQSLATASLWDAIWPGEQPVDPPAVLPAPKGNRAPRLAILAFHLLEVAQPAQFKAWRLVTLPNVGNPETQEGMPFGLSILTVDGGRTLLRASATGAPQTEPEEDPFPGWTPDHSALLAALA